MKLWLLALLSLPCIASLPILSKRAVTTTKIPSIEAFNFMKRFGYLEEGNGDSEALYSEQAISNAIKTVQKFGAIPQTGVIDNATLELMKARRCGVPDVIKNGRAKRYALGPAKWKKRHITYFLANWSPKLGEDTTATKIQQSLDIWGRYGKLTFSRVNDPSGDIAVAFARGPHGDSFPFDGPGGILAHAYFPYDHSTHGGDVHFDEDEDWSIHSEESQRGTDFFMVAIHELGHSLGLSHSPEQSSIMFPYYKGFSPEFALGYDDILGMYELYIKGNPGALPPPRAETTTEKEFEHTTYRYSQETTFNGNRDEFEDNFDKHKHVGSSTISYEGDWESVDDHKNHEPKPGAPATPSKNNSAIPDICEGNFDAVATLRDELFIFKGQYIWRLKEKYIVESGYPVKFHQMFPKLPNAVKMIDAAYQRPDGMIILFTGNKYWIYNGQDFIDNSPRPLQDLGLPEYVDKIDAVQTWGKNGKTYFYRDDRFWRYNEATRSMDPEYPKHMEMWRGVPDNLDAATTWKDGYTYFFKDKFFWKFDNDWIIVTESSPLPAPQMWLGCPEKEDLRNYFSQRGSD